MKSNDPTAARRQQARRDRQKNAGLEEVRNIWAPIALHAGIKSSAQVIIDSHSTGRLVVSSTDRDQK
jgi:hypothetical protein